MRGKGWYTNKIGKQGEKLNEDNKATIILLEDIRLDVNESAKEVDDLLSRSPERPYINVTGEDGLSTLALRIMKSSILYYY